MRWWGALVCSACLAVAALGWTPLASAVGCDTSWVSAASGNWNTSANWTAGVPTSSTNACITVTGSYTVTLQGSAAAASLTLGAPSGTTPEQALDIQGTPSSSATLTLGSSGGTITGAGQLVLDSQSGGYSTYVEGGALTNDGSIVTQGEGTSPDPDYLRVALNNTATIEVKSGELLQDQNTTTTNTGTVTLDTGASYMLTGSGGTFANDTGGSVTDGGSIELEGGSTWSQAGGSETTGMSGTPVVLNSATLDDDGTGSSGQFELVNGDNLSGTIAAGETVTIAGTPSASGTTTLTSAVTNDGRLVLDNQASGYPTYLQGDALTNDGSILTQAEGTDPNYLRVNVDNTATIEVKSGELLQDQNTTTTNTGTVTLDTGASYMLTGSGGTFANDTGGSVTDGGSIELEGGSTWSQAGGSETTGMSGTPVVLNSATLDDDGTGSSGQFELVNGDNLSGTIAAGETVTIAGTPSASGTTTLTSAVTNDGRLVLDNQASGYPTYLQGDALTNDGSILTQAEGTDPNYLRVNVDNTATIEVKSGELLQDQNTTTTNTGTVTLDTGASYMLTGSGGTFANDTGGSVTDSGSIELEGGSTWSQAGGSETTGMSGTPVVLNSATLDDDGTGSSGQFELVNGDNLSGTIAAGETVTIAGTPSASGTTTVASNGVTNKGAIVLDSQSGGYSTYVQGGRLTNDGSIVTQGEGAAPDPDYLRVALDNAGTLEVRSGQLIQDQGTATTNTGKFTTDAAASYAITSGSGSFLNSVHGSAIDDGSLVLSGGSSWSQAGGSESGLDPVVLNSATLDDDGTGSSGQFELVNGDNLSGTIAAGETVTIAGTPSASGTTTLTSAVTNDGRLVLDNQASGYPTYLQGDALTNDGSILTQAEGTDPNYLRVNVDNTATIEVKSGELLQDQNTTTTNTGTVTLDTGAQFDVTSGSGVLDDASGGNLTFGIAGPSSFGTLNLSGGATLTLDGGAATAVLAGGYAPTVGTEFQVITGSNGAGKTFASVGGDFTGDYSHSGFIALVRGRDSTTTSLRSSQNPSTSGQSVTFTATITPSPGGAGTPTGTVTFADDGVTIATPQAVATSGAVTTATLTSSSLAIGTQSITASYNGDANYQPSPASSPALQQNVEPPPAQPASSTPPAGSQSSYGSDAPASSASATVTVPAVSCGGNPAGTFAGQEAVVRLIGDETSSGSSVQPAESVELRTYCQGASPVYATEFVINDVTSGMLTFEPAGVTVAPGDSLQMSVAATPSGATLQVSDLDTGAHASATGPGFTALDGADVLVGGIESADHSAPLISGAMSANPPAAQLAGPVPSSPVVFENVLIDGKPLSGLGGSYDLTWKGPGSQTVASVSPIFGTDGFSVAFSTPRPVLTASADATPVSGTVEVELPHSHHFVTLTSVKSIPVGSIINATRGSVQLTVAIPGGGEQSGVFFGGEFIVRQSRTGQMTAVLTGGSFAGCAKPSRHAAPDAIVSSASRHRPKKIRQLWADAHGNFSTQGKYGAAAVRGTEWLTADECDGTYFFVKRHKILVTAFALHNRRTLVAQGHHYLAPAPG